MIAVVAIVLGMCYFMWKEIKRTQGDVSGLKNFSGRVANFIESAQVAAAPISAPPAVQEKKVSEEKEE